MKILMKFIHTFLGLIILTQSCATYSGNYTLDQAVTQQRKAKIITVDERVMIYQKIDTLNEEYIGVNYKRNQPQNVILDENSVNQVQLIEEDQTKKKNTKLIGISAAVAAAVIIGVILISNIKVGLPDQN
ncbi:MAG: hypothetical protein KJO00_12190 [Bacteroidia bacterium]|nr:hypothetical protein [Bacteroidia bacterium]